MPSSVPPPARPGLARAVPSPSDVVPLARVRRQRAIARKRGRDSALSLLIDAMSSARADHYDLAQALGVNDRVARRILDGDAPFELGDLFAIARGGRGGVRLDREILRRLEVAIDEIAAEHVSPLRHHG